MANYVLASSDGIATTKYGSSVKNQISKRTLTGVLSYNIAFRDVNLARNPYKNRYSNEGLTTDMNGFEKIGKYIDVYDHEKHIITFLDDWGGLTGYTVSNKYKPNFTDYREIYSISGTDFYSVSTKLNAYSYQESMSIDDGVQENGKEYLKIKNLTTYTPRKILTQASTYAIYQEDGIPTIDDLDHITHHEQVEVIEEDDEYEETSLLNKTNKLFRDGKIHSLINRFGTGAIGDAAEAKRDLLHTAFSEFGFSRGRNLLKIDPDVVNTYENPYCRVWTSHHQYSRMTDLIRPFVDDFGQFESLFELQRKYGMLRPNYSNARLRDYSSLERGGILRIAPDKEFLFGQGFAIENHGDIRNYMLSIENLAWKNAGEFYTSYLSSEQKGPFGGRIMWFAPYGLTFSEGSSAEWNSVSFIGRGENVYTYKGSQRTGNLSFDIVVDHPSVLTLFKEKKTINEEEEAEQALLRFFAGCDDLNAYLPTNNPQEWIHYSAYTENVTDVKTTKTTGEVTENGDDTGQNTENLTEPGGDPTFEIGKEGYNCVFLVFYPNNVTGQYLIEKGRYTSIEGQRKTKATTGDKRGSNASDFLINEIKVHGYECNGTGQKETDKYYENLSNYPEEACPKSGGHAVIGACPDDSFDYGLNTGAFIEAVNSLISNTTDTKTRDSDTVVAGTQLTYAKVSNIISALGISTGSSKFYGLQNLSDYTSQDGFIKLLKDINIPEEKATTQNYKISNVRYYGYASNAGYNNIPKSPKYRGPIDTQYNSRNDELAHNRAETLYFTLENGLGLGKNYLKKGMSNAGENSDGSGLQSTINLGSGSNTIDDIDAKLGRAAALIVTIKRSEDSQDSDDDTETNNKTIPEQDPETYVTGKTEATVVSYTVPKIKYFDWSENVDTVAFDNEYLMFDRIKNEDDEVSQKTLMEKLKFFEAGIHSTTPEGFNARLTFLNQCVRQGPTNGASDTNNRSTFGAANLAFGKPPVCVLRIGDFYFGKVIFTSLSITYDNGGIQWDMNPEGIGLQPMKARVNLGVTFLGGMDITGPIEQLQNAVSSNYYANASIYDKSASTNDIGEYNKNGIRKNDGSSKSK